MELFNNLNNLFGGGTINNQKNSDTKKKKNILDEKWQKNVLNDILNDDDNQFLYDITNFNPYELLTSCNNSIKDSLFFAILEKITKKKSNFNMLETLINKYPKLKTVSNCSDTKIKNIIVRLTPILYGVYKNDKLLIKFLLEKDKSLIKSRDEVSGNCPLGLAALLGNIEMIEYLLNVEGVDIDQGNTKGRTPLLLATGERERLDKDNKDASHYLEVIKLLQTQGASLTKDDENGHFPLERLQKFPPKGNPKFTDALLNYAKVDDLVKANGKGDTAIHHAVNANNYHHTDLIANKIGNNINDPNKEGKTVAHMSVENGNHEILENLSKRRQLSLSEPDKNGNGPFHKATEGKDHKALHIMFKGPKNTLLTKDKEHEDKVKGALNLKNRKGHTPLGVSVKHNDFDTSTLLLKHGSNPDDNLDNKEDTSLLGHSLKNKNYHIAQQLVNSGADINKSTVHRPNGEKVPPIVDAVKHNNIKKLKFCLDNGAKTTVTNSKGQTPLIIACKNLVEEKDKKNIKKTQKLIDDLLVHTNPKNVNEKDEDGNTALHYLSMIERKGKKEPHPKSKEVAEHLSKELLKKGADPNIKNDDDSKPEDITKNKNILHSIKTHVPETDYSDTSSLTSDDDLKKPRVCPKKGQKLKIIQTCVDTENDSDSHLYDSDNDSHLYDSDNDSHLYDSDSDSHLYDSDSYLSRNEYDRDLNGRDLNGSDLSRNEYDRDLNGRDLNGSDLSRNEYDRDLNGRDLSRNEYDSNFMNRLFNTDNSDNGDKKSNTTSLYPYEY